MSTVLLMKLTSSTASRTPPSGFFDAWVRPVKAHHWLIVTAPDRPRVCAESDARVGDGFCFSDGGRTAP